MVRCLRGWVQARDRMMVMVLGLMILGGCASEPASDPRQAVRDHLFYDGLAAFHEGFYQEAAARWERAAHFGDGDAARNLGHLYRQGLGVEQNCATAAEWYRIAADAGVVTAQYNLGMLYLNGGPNFPENRMQAQLWLSKAATAGIVPAKQELARLDSAEPPVAEPAAATAPATLPDPLIPPPVSAAPPAATASVQIGSYQTRKAAEADMQRLTRRSDLDFKVIAAGRINGQHWYRLMAAGKPEEVEAYCRQAASHRIGCWPHNNPVPSN